MVRFDRRPHCSLFSSFWLIPKAPKERLEMMHRPSNPSLLLFWIILLKVSALFCVRGEWHPGHRWSRRAVSTPSGFLCSCERYTMIMHCFHHDVPPQSYPRYHTRQWHLCRLGVKRMTYLCFCVTTDTALRRRVCFCVVRSVAWKHKYRCLMCIVWARSLIVAHRRAIHHTGFIVFRIVSSPCHRQLCFISERPLRSSLHKKLVKTEGREEEALKQQRASPP